MPGKCRPSLRQKTLDNVLRSNLSQTDKACIEEAFNLLKTYEVLDDDGRFLWLPCKVGTHLWKVTHPYRQEPKVTEFVVKNFRTTGKRHQLQLEVQAVNTPGTNWMPFSAFKSTREEAENELNNGGQTT